VTGPCTPQLNAHKLGKIAATSDTNNSTTMDTIAIAIIWLDGQSEPNYTEAAKKFGVNRTTLSRRHRGITTSRKQFTSTFKKNLTDAQEEQLLDY
jgi:hypothetical protein